MTSEQATQDKLGPLLQAEGIAPFIIEIFNIIQKNDKKSLLLTTLQSEALWIVAHLCGHELAS